jgi:competence protein ComEC
VNDPPRETGAAAPTPDDAPTAGELLGPLTPWAVAAVAAAAVGGPLGSHLRDRVRDAVVDGAAAGLRWAVAGGAVVLVAGLVATTRSTSARRRGVTALVLVAAGAASGAMVRTATHELGALPALAAAGGRAEVAFTVASEPKPIATGWHVPVEVTALDGAVVRERAAVTLPEDTVAAAPHDGSPPALGTRWATTATARPPPDGGYGRWLAQQHLTVILDVAALTPTDAPGWFARTSEAVRHRTRTAATRAEVDATGGLLVGLVTGDVRRLPTADQDAMQATGLTHLTAVSGSNVAVVAAGVLALCGLARAGARTRRVAVAVVLGWFAYLTRFEPSVMRAGAMAAMVLLAASRGVLRDARHALSGAVLLLVLLDPLVAGSLGLLLSATATAGVLVVAPRVRDRLHRLPRRLAELTGITIGAQVAVVPLLLASFGEVPLASVPANVLAVPLAAAAAVVAFPATVMSIVHVDAGAALFVLARPQAAGILAIAHRFDGVGGAAALAAPVTVVALVAGACWVATRPGSPAARVTAAATAFACVAAAVQPLGGRVLPARTFTVTAIDVGQGDAFLVRTPQTRVLVDAGEDDTAARWLARNGHVDLDLLVVTHGHLDHVGGATDVIDAARVGAVWRPPSPVPVAAIVALDRAAAAAAVPVREVVHGAVVTVGDLHLEVLGPPPELFPHAPSPLNDGSVVLRATWHDRVAVFTGDVEHAAQGWLLAHARRLDAGLVTVPHHGAGTTDPAFLAALGATVGLVSAGVDNPHGHPHIDTLAVLDHLGTEVRRTDLEGTVTVEVPAHTPAHVSSHAPGQTPTHASTHTPARTAPDSGAARLRRRRTPSVACAHGCRPPPRRRRRPAAPTRARAGPRRPTRRRPRARGRGPRRDRDPAPARAAHSVALRRAHLRGAPRRRGRVRRPQGRGRALPRGPIGRRRAGARRPRARQGAEDRQARQGQRRAHRRQGTGGLGRPGVGPARR